MFNRFVMFGTLWSALMLSLVTASITAWFKPVNKPTPSVGASITERGGLIRESVLEETILEEAILEEEIIEEDTIVEKKYVDDEYLKELDYNSKKNVYFTK